MDPKARAHSRTARFAILRARISPETRAKLRLATRLSRIKYNSVGELMDLCADVILEFTRSPDFPSAKREWRLSNAQVLSIRASPDKMAAIAAEHGISEVMVSYIKSRKRYQWVIDDVAEK